MDSFQLPEDLTTLDPDALQGLVDQISKSAEDLAEKGADSDEDVVALERLADALDAVKGEQSRRGEAAAERQARQEAAIKRFRGESDIADAPADGADDDKAGAAPEGDAAAPAPSEAAPALVASPGKRGPGALAGKQPKSAKQSVRPIERGEFAMTATREASGFTAGGRLTSVDQVAEAICNRRNRFSSSYHGEAELLPVAQGMTFGIDRSLGLDPIENFKVLREVQAATKDALVASGPICAPLQPTYDFYRLAEPQTPVEDDTPVVQAPRGGIRFLVPVSAAQAAGAIDISAVDRDYAEGQDGTKAVLHVDCPTEDTEGVEAISTIVEFDNLQYKVFPEQVAAFLEDLQVMLASTTEVYYLDYINSHSTPTTGAFAYGASRSLLHDWTVAAVAYRKRHGMKRGAELTVVAPDWALDVIKLDMAMDAANGLDYFNITDQQAMAAVTSRGLRPIWYNDNPTGVTPSQKFNAAQTTGALLLFPEKVVSFMYAPGTFVRLDAGTLDVGLVRDSVLNGTNDLQLFAEKWIGMAKLGFESVRITSTVVANGAAPEGVTVATAA